jgi:imidazoleglycerol phosphate synthase glutamine amidotransferase subunit HisH
MNFITISNNFKKDERNEIHVFNTDRESIDTFSINDHNILEMGWSYCNNPNESVNIISINSNGNYKFHFNDILLEAIPYRVIFEFNCEYVYSAIEKEINEILSINLPEETFYFISSYFQDAGELDKIYVYSTERIPDILYDKINMILQLKL